MGEKKLTLRCFAHRRTNGTWYGLCLDLNIAAEAGTYEQVREKINGMIDSYFEAVLDTEDKESIRRLLCRKAPIQDWCIYYVLRIISYIKRFRGNFTFTVPSKLAYDC